MVLALWAYLSARPIPLSCGIVSLLIIGAAEYGKVIRCIHAPHPWGACKVRPIPLSCGIVPPRSTILSLLGLLYSAVM